MHAVPSRQGDTGARLEECERLRVPGGLLLGRHGRVLAYVDHAQLIRRAERRRS